MNSKSTDRGRKKNKQGENYLYKRYNQFQSILKNNDLGKTRNSRDVIMSESSKNTVDGKGMERGSFQQNKKRENYLKE